MKYKSRYSPGKDITCFNLIMEIVCENSAKKDGKELPTFFWDLPEWKNKYKIQLRACSKLIKEHGEEKVLAFVKKHRIYTLNSKKVQEWLSDFKWTPPTIVKKPELNIQPEGESSKKTIKGYNKLL